MGRDGYGRVRSPRNWRSLVGPHRAAWEMANGAVPDGLSVLHHCDNPLCVRADHLFLGTHRDNMADMVAKGRSTKGERNAKTSLTENDVRAIRRATAEGEPERSIARRFGIGYSTAYRVGHRQSWGHVGD